MSEPDNFPPPAAPDDPDDTTTFEGVEIGDDAPPAQDETLPDDEKIAIAQQRDEIIANNSGRPADEQSSVSPDEVN